jgi:DNA-binding transcriptional MerR regulator
MSQLNYIINLCYDIQAQGKAPSVALIRKMSDRPLSIPEVIKALQNWKADPEQGRQKEPQRPMKPAVSLEKRVEQLEAQLVDLVQQINELKAR